jgi:hypothetical protein
MKRLREAKGKEVEELNELWLEYWHLKNGFSAKRPAEQWLIVILEWIGRKDDKEKDSGTPA